MAHHSLPGIGVHISDFSDMAPCRQILLDPDDRAFSACAGILEQLSLHVPHIYHTSDSTV